MNPLHFAVKIFRKWIRKRTVLVLLYNKGYLDRCLKGAWVFRSFLIFIVLAFTLIMPALSSAKVNRIYEPLLVSQGIYVSPHRVCHDGLHLYFTSIEQCQKARIGMDCKLQQAIAPLRSAESIYLNKVTGPSITRFYHIKTRFRYQEVDNQKGELSLEEDRDVPLCKGKPRFNTENVRSSRPVRNEKERIFVQSLVDQSIKNSDESFLLINTPVGNVERVENLDLDDLFKTEFELDGKLVKTPFCSEYSQSQVWKMSGEYTGSGLRGLQPARLQTISKPMYVKSIHHVKNKVTGQIETRYEFTCDRVWEI